MASGRQVEFVAVPRAYDVALFAEAEPRALLVWRDYFLDLIENLALADRATGMRTDILIGQHLAADAENADFERFEREDPIIPVCDIGQLANRDFFHRKSPLFDPRRPVEPDRHVEHVEVGGANEAAGGHDRLGG